MHQIVYYFDKFLNSYITVYDRHCRKTFKATSVFYAFVFELGVRTKLTDRQTDGQTGKTSNAVYKATDLKLKKIKPAARVFHFGLFYFRGVQHTFRMAAFCTKRRGPEVLDWNRT